MMSVKSKITKVTGIIKGKKQEVTAHYEDGSSDVLISSGTLSKKFMSVRDFPKDCYETQKQVWVHPFITFHSSKEKSMSSVSTLGWVCESVKSFEIEY